MKFLMVLKGRKIVDTFYVTMTEYDRTIENVHVVYTDESL